MHSANELHHFCEPLVHKIASFDTVQEASRIWIDMKFNEFTDTFNWFKDRLIKKRHQINYSSRGTMQRVRCAVRKTIGSCLPQENHREVFHQILQTGPPSLSVPPGLPEPNDVSMAWLCHRSYEAMTEVRPRLYRGHSYDQPTKTYPVRQGEIFEISKKGNATVFQDVARKSIVARYDDQDFLRRYPWTRLMRVSEKRGDIWNLSGSQNPGEPLPYVALTKIFRRMEKSFLTSDDPL
jgi:hypothetical protein